MSRGVPPMGLVLRLFGVETLLVLAAGSPRGQQLDRAGRADRTGGDRAWEIVYLHACFERPH